MAKPIIMTIDDEPHVADHCLVEDRVDGLTFVNGTLRQAAYPGSFGGGRCHVRERTALSAPGLSGDPLRHRAAGGNTSSVAR